MINAFRMKKTPALRACQWNGENRREIEEFIGNAGYVQGSYVMIGAVDSWNKPTIQNVSVGNYVVEQDGKFRGMLASELFDLYELED